MKKMVILLTIIMLLFGAIKIGSEKENKKILSNNKISYIEYTVKKGDSVEGIAKKYSTDTIPAEKIKTKIQIKNNINEVIYPGDILLIPKVAE